MKTDFYSALQNKLDHLGNQAFCEAESSVFIQF